MDYTGFLLFCVFLLEGVNCQHEDISYESVEKICDKCECQAMKSPIGRHYYTLNCAEKNFKHILARWPGEFGSDHNGVQLEATFSGNSITLLQQLPPTNSSLSFICRHCSIKEIQAPTFIDVPKLKKLDLSWNQLTSDQLTSDVFRGPYRMNNYESIALLNLVLSHNELHSLNRRLFEHIPNLTKLSLGHNQLSVLDNPTTMAICGCYFLEFLDLSYNGLSDIPVEIFKLLVNLKFLMLNGNKFKTIPESLRLVSGTLKTLNIAENPIEKINKQSCIGLLEITHMNISGMTNLKKIGSDVFSQMKSLEYLFCAHNPQLKEFPLDSLMECKNLTHLDISFCSLSAIPTNSNPTNVTSNTWKNVHTFKINGNPWKCDCQFLKILEKFRYRDHFNKEMEKTEQFARCSNPFAFAGARVFDLSSQLLCSSPMASKYQIAEDQPPRFLRKHYIILSAFTVITVIVLGLSVGFLTVYIQRKLRKGNFGAYVEPIRYTSIRCSNVSNITSTTTATTTTTANSTNTVL